MKYDLSLIIGRFEPWHKGHDSLDDLAASLAPNGLILLGSANQARSPKNPFTHKERFDMISKRKIAKQNQDTNILPISDFYYSDEDWCDEVRKIVRDEADLQGFGGSRAKVCIVGREKDESSYYLRLFPEFDFIEHPDAKMDATTIRNLWLSARFSEAEPLMPPETYKYVLDWTRRHPDTYGWLRDYKDACDSYTYGPGPHVTTDAMVTCCGHILLIQRKTQPGKDLWALPGGFLGKNERIEDGLIRELREETCLKVPAPVLRGSINRRASRVFDHPGRDLRARIITHAYRIDLFDSEFPKVKARSDAKHAEWKSLRWVRENKHLFYADHYSMIEWMIAGGNK